MQILARDGHKYDSGRRYRAADPQAPLPRWRRRRQQSRESAPANISILTRREKTVETSANINLLNLSAIKSSLSSYACPPSSATESTNTSTRARSTFQLHYGQRSAGPLSPTSTDGQSRKLADSYTWKRTLYHTPSPEISAFSIFRVSALKNTVDASACACHTPEIMFGRGNS